MKNIKLTVKKKRELIKSLASFYGVKLKINTKPDSHANVDLINDIIYVHTNTLYADVDFLLSCFFHELAHLHCKYLNKYPLFHKDTLLITKSEQPHFLKTVWRAEVFVDKLGSIFMNNHFPSLKFHFGYTNKTKRTFYKEMISDYIKHFTYINQKSIY